MRWLRFYAVVCKKSIEVHYKYKSVRERANGYN